MMYKYVIIDDEYLTRAGLLKKIESLSHLITCVGEAENGEDGINLIDKLKPDFIITDMYMPVMDGNELLQYVAVNYPQIQIIVISGYRNFEYAQNAIHSKAITYLLKPFSSADIQTAIHTAINRICEQRGLSELHQISETMDRMAYEFDIQILRSLVMGATMDCVDFSSKTIQEHLKQKHYSLLTIVNASIISQSRLFDACNAFFQEVQKLRVTCFDYYSTSEFVFAIIFSANFQFSRNNASQFAYRLADYLRTSGFTPNIGISIPHANITELHQAFLECVTALDNKQLTMLDGTFFYDGTYSLNYRNITWKDEQKFRLYVDMGLEERVLRLLEQFFPNLAIGENSYTLMDFKYYFLHLINEIGQGRAPSTIPISTDISDSYRQQIKYIFDTDTLIQRTKETIQTICQRNLANPIYSTDKTSDAIVQNMQEYIKRNYSHNISLEFVADLFFLNKNYASALFKAKSGVKFIDYLTHTRIEKAKELLSTSTLKIPQIAVNVGYSNTKYFYRVFKKLTGYTPEEYRTL